MADVEPIPWLTAPRAALAALRARGAHALLLHGPAGTGKWDLAMSFACDVLCEHAVPPARACGICASCRLMAAGNHPDLRVVVPDAMAERRPGAAEQDGEDAAASAADASTAPKTKPSREIKIDQVRELVSLTGLSAHRGGARVVVLGPAEFLNLSAANSLLKGLEEPPPESLFLLVCDQIDRCLPTIVSRCTLVRVAVPPRELAVRWLQAQGVGEDAGRRLVEAGGAPLAALRAGEEALAPEMRASLLALLRRGSVLAPADVANDVPRTVPILASIALFQRWGWDYFCFRTGGRLRYHPEDAASFEALSRHWSLRAAAAWIDRLRALRAVAEHPLNARAAIEGVLLDYIGSIAAGREGR
ncbi:DNA polymerase III, delta' subunit [Burkholderiales bacterium]|nr:DNA polymerase III, delta' subunit [Burkholderiales bacterium]